MARIAGVDIPDKKKRRNSPHLHLWNRKKVQHKKF